MGAAAAERFGCYAPELRVCLLAAQTLGEVRVDSAAGVFTQVSLGACLSVASVAVDSASGALIRLISRLPALSFHSSAPLRASQQVFTFENSAVSSLLPRSPSAGAITLTCSRPNVTVSLAPFLGSACALAELDSNGTLGVVSAAGGAVSLSLNASFFACSAQQQQLRIAVDGSCRVTASTATAAGQEQLLLSVEALPAGLSVDVWVRSRLFRCPAACASGEEGNQLQNSLLTSFPPRSLSQGPKAGVSAAGGGSALLPLCVGSDPAFISLNSTGVLTSSLPLSSRQHLLTSMRSFPRPRAARAQAS